jgi:uncharacterized protein
MRMTDVRPQGATSVITHVVKAGSEAAFERWIDDVTRAASGFPGHHATTVLRPRAGEREYTVVLHFESAAELQEWLGSDVRREWIDRVRPLTEGERRTVLTGLEHWFTPERRGNPPRWKMAALTILGLEAGLAPVLARVPRVAGPLVITVCMTLLLTYAFMPALSRLTSRWLRR